MSEHTQGRIWLNTEGSAIVHGEDGRIACPPNHSQRWAWKENARRLVACWNACDGFSTEVLESILTMGDTMKSRFAMRDKVEQDLTAQRDELLEALKLCEGNISSLLASQHPKVFGTWLEVVRAAIAKAEGEK